MLGKDSSSSILFIRKVSTFPLNSSDIESNVEVSLYLDATKQRFQDSLSFTS